MRKIAALEKVDIDQDPREALLKYAKVMIHELLPLVANILVSHFQLLGNVKYCGGEPEQATTIATQIDQASR